MSPERPSWWRVSFPPEEGTLGELVGVLLMVVLIPILLLWEWLDNWRRS